eukprot:CAMPEP_0197588362 /NCGR_PEP_ID=MMETSP1326-20131121/9670_1 /TAXON_ID=1155430 /ORGANISM="Genus nov. species nov., Strain RCC2288" /LENGTH=288 /DNA_ID=CAMNT_0043153181 /DNA_START=72 /DNA_END=938 /DNA_ORIENTATION=-
MSCTMNLAASARAPVAVKRGSAVSLRRAAAAKPTKAGKSVVSCSVRSDDAPGPMKRFGAAVVGLGAAATLAMGAPAALASELEILQTPAPVSGKGYIVDDGALLSRASAGEINAKLKDLEEKTGYHVNVVTIRKLVFEQDPFAFGDKVLESWYPTLADGDMKGQILLVKNTKEGSVVGGPKFLKAVGNDVLDSILSKNIPFNLEDEKFGEALTSSVDRIVAVLEGKEDPGPPVRFEKNKNRTFKTKAETNDKREVFSNVVIGLLVISFVVPMVQYFGYVAGDPDFDDN